MRYYSNLSSHMVISRETGYYMSSTTARRVARKLAIVLEMVNEVTIQGIADKLSGHDPDGIVDQWLTPTEYDAVRRLMCWYSYEYHMDATNPKRKVTYILCNLNAGTSLVISDRK